MARTVTLDTAQMAKLINVNPRTVRKLASEGVLERARDETGETIQGRWEMLKNNWAYIAYIMEQGRWEDASETKKGLLTNRKLAAEAELAELRLKREKGELHGRDDVEFWVTQSFTRFKARIQAVPQRVARQLVGVTDQREIRRILSEELDLALRELAVPDSRSFSRANERMLAEQGAGADLLAELSSKTNGAEEDETEIVDD